ncbi:hypothetical protein FC72_GL000826 [Companilactobacillus tucceti DSM 20183]|uniref:Uncharacterized protein n=1 Tax=Companilactobacillus tucceti DSM 20183 TaxID=1423811 RepID=A0A0R1IXF3_9LACO|nr:LVIS_2131 family protein [Companilactobacillus tucceti]KRK63941.1 hypothetical protein FC72_GL000826 [Companilactobacillus tucceti DSM 20183]
MSSWNLIGIIAWVVVIALLVWVVFNIRNRHLKLLVVKKEKITWKTVLTDLIEIIVVIAAVVGMLYACLFSNADLSSKKDISMSYKYEPMIIQTTEDGQGYYVKISKGNSHGNNDVYQYWVNNSTYNVSSRDATISDATLPFNFSGVRISWPVDKFKQMDDKYQSAYVITAQAKYKKNFINGLGLKAGRLATEYRVLRVPARSFIDVSHSK